MSYSFPYERTTEELVNAYVLSRTKAKCLFLHQAIRAIRALSPECGASDQELENMIEAAAIQRGVTVLDARNDQNFNFQQLAS